MSAISNNEGAEKTKAPISRAPSDYTGLRDWRGWDYRDDGKVVVVVVVKAKDSTRDACAGRGHQRHRLGYSTRPKNNGIDFR